MFWFALYGVLAAMVLVVSTIAERHIAWDNLVGGSLILFASYLVSNAITLLGTGAHHVYFPYLDVALVAVFAAQWRWNAKAWSLCVAGLLLFQCYLHYTFRTSGMHDYEARYAYDLSLNLVFALQLCCILFAGVWQIIVKDGAREYSAN